MQSIALPGFQYLGVELTPRLLPYRQTDADNQPICAIQIVNDSLTWATLSYQQDGDQPGEWSFWIKSWSENQVLIQPFFRGCRWAQMDSNIPNRCLISPEMLPSETVQSIGQLMKWSEELQTVTLSPS